MRRIKKPLAVILCACMCIGMLLSVMLSAGVNIVFAADAKRELWLIDDVNYALVKGTRKALSDTEDLSPYQNDTGTMYVPVSIICDYMGATYTYNAESGAVDITLKSGSLVSLSVGSMSWTLKGKRGFPY